MPELASHPSAARGAVRAGFFSAGLHSRKTKLPPDLIRPRQSAPRVLCRRLHKPDTPAVTFNPVKDTPDETPDQEQKTLCCLLSRCWLGEWAVLETLALDL
jgi:hypothetical protein